MIKTETRIINGRELMYAYSDEGYMLIQDGTGYTYAEAYDPLGSDRTYTESEEKIPEDGLIEDDYAI